MNPHMRWQVEVTSMDRADAQSVVVEAESWQKALQAARASRGETGPISGFSIELLDEGYRAVDPLARLRYDVRRAADGTPTTINGPAPSAPPPAPTAGASPPRPAAKPSAPAPSKKPAAPFKAAQTVVGVPVLETPGADATIKTAPLTEAAAAKASDSLEIEVIADASTKVAAQPHAPPPPPPPVAHAPPPPPPVVHAVPPPAPPAPVDHGPVPPTQVIFKREHDPTERLPLTYREYVFTVAKGVDEAAGERLLRTQLDQVRASIASSRPGKFVQLAVFDVVFQGRPPVPPLATLAWKDWKGEPDVAFPRRSGGNHHAAPIEPQRIVSVVPPAPERPAPFAPPVAPPPSFPAPAFPPPVAHAAPPAPAPAPVHAPTPPPPPPAPHNPFVQPTPFAPIEPTGQAFPTGAHNVPAHLVADPFAPNNAAPLPPGVPVPANAAPVAPPPVGAEFPAPPARRSGDTGPHAAQRGSSPRITPTPSRPSFRPLAAGRRATGDELIANLFEAMHELRFSRDVIEGGDYVLALALEMIPSRAGIVHLYDIDRREFVVANVSGPATDVLLNRRHPENEPLLSAAMRKRRAVVIPDGKADEMAQAERFALIGGAATIVCSPVLKGGRFLGAIEIVNPIDGIPYTEHEGNAIDYICEQFADFVAERGMQLDPDRIVRSVPPSQL